MHCPFHSTRWFLIALILFAGNAMAETIGNPDVPSNGSSGIQRSQGFWAASQYTVSTGGTLTSASGYFRNNADGTDSIQIFIYSDNAGLPGTLLDTTAWFEVTSDASSPWSQYTGKLFINGATVSAGVVWMGFYSRNSAAVVRCGRTATGTLGIRGVNSADPAPIAATAQASSSIDASNVLTITAVVTGAAGGTILLGGGTAGGIN